MKILLSALLFLFSPACHHASERQAETAAPTGTPNYTTPAPQKTTARPADAQLSRALLTAAEEGDTLKVRELLQKGADPNAANTDGKTLTALMLAAAGGHAPTVKALIEAGANVNATGAVMAGAARVNQNLTPLMQAVSSGDQETVSLLIRKGADVNARDKTSAIENNGAEKELNRRPVLLHFTNAPVLRTLLEHGADPNAADSNGTTALMIAAERGDTLSVQTLLSKGANAKARRRDGMTALSLATRAGKKAIVSMLSKAGAKS